MTELYRCDRCGITLERKHKFAVTSYTENYTQDLKLDFCLNCYGDFREWVKSGIMIPEDFVEKLA